MTRLIKSQDAPARVRAVPPTPPEESRRPPAQVVDVEVVALRREVEALSRALHDREVELEHLRGDVDRAYDAGESAGRRAGLSEAVDRKAESLARLEQGVVRACQAFERDLAQVETLAALLAREAISMIFGQTDRAGLVADIVRKQIADLEGHSILGITVSAADFADPADLAPVQDAIGNRQLDLNVADDLPAGDCRIKLRLGGLEVGVGQQWSRISTVLTQLAAGQATA